MNFVVAVLRNRLVEVLTVLSCLAFSCLFLPFTQDDYGSFATAMAAGQFSDFSLIDWYFLGYTGFNTIYKALHNVIPQVNWLGLGTYVMSIVGFYLCLRVINISLNQIASKSILWISNLYFGLLYLDSLISISHTRASLIMCGGSALYLLLVPKISVKKIFLINLIFITGLLHRGESAIGILWVVGLASLLFSFPIKYSIQRLGPPIICTGLFFLAVFIYWSKTTSFIVKIEPEIEYEFMSGNIINLSVCQTETDSVKYLMATYGIWIDPKVVSADYMRTLIRDSQFSIEKLHRAFVAIKNYLIFYSGISVLLLASIWFLIIKKAAIQSGLKLLFYLGLSFLPLLYLSYKTLLSERHFFPIIFVLGVVVVIYFVKACSTKNPSFASFKWNVAWSLILVVFGLSSIISNYSRKNKIDELQVVCAEQAMKQLESSFSNRVIVLTTGSFHIMDHNFSFWTKNYSGNTYIMYDLFNYSLVPSYTAYLSTLCFCDATEPEQFFQWLSHQNALYLGEDERLKITSAYMKSVYEKNLQFLPVDNFSFDSCIENHYSYLRSTHMRQVQMQNL